MGHPAFGLKVSGYKVGDAMQPTGEALPFANLRRFASKDEIADLALFLSSDAAAYITGAVFVCDGGQSLTGSNFATTAPE